ncbi:MAG TPA: hypothetical protein VLA72_02110 [Anaerolineales bacterium]|nr:hypothetical protein [Anaerolineales bacterium]
MSKSTYSRFWFYLISSIVIITALSGGWYVAYNLGYNQGAIVEQTQEAECIPQPIPFWGFMGRYNPYGMWSFFFGFLFFCMMIALIRRLFFFPPWSRHAGPYRHKAWKHYPMWHWFNDENESNTEDASEHS